MGIHTPVIKSIIDHKWRAFGRRAFQGRAIKLTVHLTLLTVAMFLQPYCPNDLLPIFRYDLGEFFGDNDLFGPCHKREYVPVSEWLRVVLEILTVLTSVVLVVSDNIGLAEQTCANVLRQLRQGAALVVHATCMVSVWALRVISWLVCYHQNSCSDTVKEALNFFHLALLCIAIASGWMRLFSLVKGVRKLGLLVVMMNEIIEQDILRIVSILLFIVFSFSQLFFVLCTTSKHPVDKNMLRFAQNDSSVASNPLSSDPFTSIFTVFIAALAPGQLMAFEYAPTDLMYILGLFVFVIFVGFTIILLNLIIAIFNNSYMHFDRIADQEWFLQRTKSVLREERFARNRKRWKDYMVEHNAEFHKNNRKDGSVAFTFEVSTKPDFLTRDLPKRW